MCNIKELWINNAGKHIVIVLWLCISGILFWKTYNQFKYDPEYYYVHQILGSWLCISRGSAAVLNLNCGLVLLPMCKTTITVIRKLQSVVDMGTFNQLLSACKGFHIATAYSVIVMSVIHFVGHIFNARNYSINFNPEYGEVNAANFLYEEPTWIVIKTVPGVTGFLMIITLILIASSSTKINRTYNYDLFWYSHRMFIVFYLLLLVHAIRGPIKRQINLSRHTPGCNTSSPAPEPEYSFDQSTCEEKPKFQHIGCQSWLWITVPLIIYVLDTLYRIFNRSLKAKVTAMYEHTNDVIELSIQKENFKSNPGQYCLMMFPYISTVEWHPFSIIQNQDCCDRSFIVYIRTTGDWTDQVSKHLAEKTDVETQSQKIDIYIDGPFYSPMEDVFRYPVTVCIAGGIGITPFISHIRNIWSSNVSHLSRFYLIWISRDISLFCLFREDLKNLHQQCYEKNLPDFFDVQLFLTAKENLTEQESQYPGVFVTKRIQIGRPVWNEVFNRISISHKKTDIGVYVCGPRQMIKAVQHSYSNIKSSSKFYFYKETF